MSKFQIGDRVRIISHCRTQNRCGVVLGYINMYGQNRVEVQFDHSFVQAYFESSLEWIGHKVLNEEAQMAIQGNYKIALCNHVRGMNTEKTMALHYLKTKRPYILEIVFFVILQMATKCV